MPPGFRPPGPTWPGLPRGPGPAPGGTEAGLSVCPGHRGPGCLSVLGVHMTGLCGSWGCLSVCPGQVGARCLSVLGIRVPAVCLLRVSVLTCLCGSRGCSICPTGRWVPGVCPGCGGAACLSVMGIRVPAVLSVLGVHLTCLCGCWGCPIYCGQVGARCVRLSWVSGFRLSVCPGCLSDLLLWLLGLSHLPWAGGCQVSVHPGHAGPCPARPSLPPIQTAEEPHPGTPRTPGRRWHQQPHPRALHAGT